MICRRCYHEVPAGSAFCPICGAAQGTAAQEPPPTPRLPPEAAPAGSPWDDRPRRGWVAGIGETLQESLLHPTRFFRQLTPAGGAGSALLYAVVVGTVCTAVAMMWQRVMGTHLTWMHGERLLPAAAAPGLLVVFLVLPAALAAGTVVWSAVLHLSLLLLGGARSGFAATVKAVGYSHSALVLNVLPVCGAPIGAVWHAVIQVIALRELHRISTARAFWAWFLPFLAFACLVVVAASMALFGMAKFLEHVSRAGFEV